MAQHNHPPDEKDIRWEGFNCPNCPDMSTRSASWVRSGRVLIAQHEIIIVLATL